MNKVVLLLLAILLPTMAWGQSAKLSDSDRSGEYIYIYKLNEKQMRELFVDKKEVSDRYMREYVTRYRRDAKRPALTRGNYLLAQAVDNRMEFSSYTEDDMIYKIFSRRNFEIFIADKGGIPIKDAQVKIGSRRVKHDAKRETYYANKLPKGARIEIYNNGVLHYIDQQHYYPYYSGDYGRAPRWGYEVKKDLYTGYMLFNKPIYRPGDTVKMKVYMTTQKGKPFKKDANLRIVDSRSWRSSGVDTLLTTLSPYRDGAYMYEFVLNDGLGLYLDNTYSVEMVDTKDRGKKLLSGLLYYEDYELKRSRFTARTDKKEYRKGESTSIFVKATNESGMAEFDGEVEIIIEPNTSSAKYYVDSLFIPHKLWSHKVKMDKAGEIEIVVPDSIWLDGVDMGYQIGCLYLSSDNELKEAYMYVRREMSDYTLEFTQNLNKLTITEFKGGEPVVSEAKLIILGLKGELIDSLMVMLPTTIDVLQNASLYRVQSKNSEKSFFLNSGSPLSVNYTFEREGGDAVLRVQNPAGIAYWYQVTTKDGRRTLAGGYVKEGEFSKTIRNKGRLVAKIEFLSNGWINSSQKMLQDVKNEMTVEVNTPQTIYPGQNAAFEIEVMDGLGRVVEGADVTAFAYTDKFDKNNYYAPYARRSVDLTKGERTPSLNDVEIDKQKAKMEWDRWKSEMELENIEYYKFIHPEPLYSHTEPARDEVTQISPYVVIDGDVQGAHIVWIDDAPHYFSKAEQMNPYTFAVTAGKHNIRIRTFDRVVTLKNVEVKQGLKNIVSIDGEQSVEGASIEVLKINTKHKPQGRLTIDEANYISNFLISIDPNLKSLKFRNNRFSSQNALLWLPTTLHTLDRVYWVNPPKDERYNYYAPSASTSSLVGPFPYRLDADMVVDGEFINRFDVEGGYQYTPTKNSLKMKSWDVEKFSSLMNIDAYTPAMDFKEQPVTKGDVDRIIKERLEIILRERLRDFNRPHPEKAIELDEEQNNIRNRYNYQEGYLEMEMDTTADGKSIADPLYIRLYSEIDSVYYYFSGRTRNIYRLPTQSLRMRMVMSDYSIHEQMINIREGGNNYLRIRKVEPQSSCHIKQEVERDIFDNILFVDSQSIESSTYVSPDYLGKLNRDNLDRGVVTGVVKDESRNVVVGATVRVEGESIYAITDSKGGFELKVDQVLKDSIGRKLTILPPSSYPNARPITTDLIAGYDYHDCYLTLYYSNILTYSNQWLEGEQSEDGSGLRYMRGSVPGIALTSVSPAKQISSNKDEESVSMDLAGGLTEKHTIVAESLAEEYMTVAEQSIEQSIANIDDKSLIILNGLPYSGLLSDIDEQSIVSVKRVEPQEAIKLYGQQGANGVVVIVTRSTEDGFDGQGLELRRNFRDDAFWMPNLVTDRSGVARFETTYPDDITTWNTHIYAMKGRKYIAHKSVNVASFKGLSAQLSLPRFAIEGDRLDAMGRVTNYLGDTALLTLKITEGGQTTQREISVVTSHLDKISTVAQQLSKQGGDSLSIRYTIENSAGYFDGEERAIAIYPMGVELSEGVFEVINSGERNYKFDRELGSVEVYAEASSKELLLREIERVDQYPYMCNEQMASKLKALLTKKGLYAMFNMEFKEDKKVEKMIGELHKNRNEQGMWGWWGRQSTINWISKHSIEALLMAEEAGYNNLQLNREEITERLVIELNATNLKGRDRMANKREYNNNIVLLHRLGAELDFAKLLERTNSIKDTIMYDRVLSLRAKQLSGVDFSVKELMSMADSTMLGGLKWSEQTRYIPIIRYMPQLDDMQTTLLAYQILRGTEGEQGRAERVRNYLFEARKSGWWSNIYESSTIMSTILPDMIDKGESFKDVSVEINGEKISSFPYKATIEPLAGGVSVVKSGTPPLFFTAYQKRWDREPKRSNKGFEVSSAFVSSEDTVSMLTAGVKTEMIVRVKVDVDANYVVIEVPIPAGCSYDSKWQSWYSNEMHREFYRNKVAIFVSQLAKGEHIFRISLLPRYTGEYRLNPAKAELMYFPTHYGHEQMKQMVIEERVQ